MKIIDDIAMRRKAYAMSKVLRMPLKKALDTSRFFAEETNRLLADGASETEVRLILSIYRFPVDYMKL